jgi:uncharacterized membrane protein
MAQLMRSRAHWVRFAAISGILLLGLALRLYGLGNDPLWYDEICSLQSSTGHGYQAAILPLNQLIDPLQQTVDLSNAKPVWQIWATAMDHDAHPPLYFIVLRIWRDLLGSGEATVRLLSVIAAVISIGLCAAVGIELFGFVAGCWAAILMAVAAPEIYFSHEARSYTMFPAWCLLAALSVLRLERATRGAATTTPLERGWTITLVISTLAALLTHYYAALPLAVIGVYALAQLRGSARRWAAVAMLTGTLVFTVTWGPHMLRQRAVFAINKIGADERGGTDASWVMLNVPQAILREFSGVGLSEPSIARPVAILLGAGEMLALVVAIKRKDPHLLFCHAWILVTLGTLAIADLRRGTGFLSLMRYVLTAAPGAYLLVAGVGGQSRWARHAIPAIAVCICITGWSHAYASWKGEWHQYAQDLNAQRAPGDCFVFVPAPGGPADCEAFGTQYYVNGFDGPAAFLTQPADTQLLQRLRSARSIWLIAAPGSSPGILHDYLPITGRGYSRRYAGVGDVWHIMPDPRP